MITPNNDGTPNALPLTYQNATLVIVAQKDLRKRNFHFDMVLNPGVAIWYSCDSCVFCDWHDEPLQETEVPAFIHTIINRLMAVPGIEFLYFDKHSVTVGIGRSFKWSDITHHVITSVLSEKNSSADGFVIHLKTVQQRKGKPEYVISESRVEYLLGNEASVLFDAYFITDLAKEREGTVMQKAP